MVGFSGSKLYCLHNVAMQTFDVPHSAAMRAFLGRGDFDKAYQVCTAPVSHTYYGIYPRERWMCRLMSPVSSDSKSPSLVVRASKVMAVQVACLGVTDADWRVIGEAAVQALRLDQAASAYRRIRDSPMLHAVQQLSRLRSEGLPLPLTRAAALAVLVRISISNCGTDGKSLEDPCMFIPYDS